MMMIKLREKTVRQLVRSLCHAMDVNTIVAMVRRIVPDYNYHKSLSVSESVSIPTLDVVRQIVMDMRDRDIFPNFVAAMIQAEKGLMFGRKYQFIHMPDIIEELNNYGLIYNHSSDMFMENPNIRRTRNWSVLQEGQEYIVTLLRLDIVGNSRLVRKYEKSPIEHAYNNIREIVREIVESRNGRIWRWDGDGGIAAFHFDNKIVDAVLSAMEILHRSFLFNHFSNRLPEHLQMRLAVDSGPLSYTSSEEDLMYSETVKKIITLEAKYTDPDSITIGEDSRTNLHRRIIDKFRLIQTETTRKLYSYRLLWADV